MREMEGEREELKERFGLALLLMVAGEMGNTFINLIQTLHGSHYRTKLCTLLTVLTRWVDLKRGDKDAIL